MWQFQCVVIVCSFNNLMCGEIFTIVVSTLGCSTISCKFCCSGTYLRNYIAHNRRTWIIPKMIRERMHKRQDVKLDIFILCLIQTSNLHWNKEYYSANRSIQHPIQLTITLPYFAAWLLMTSPLFTKGTSTMIKLSLLFLNNWVTSAIWQGYSDPSCFQMLLRGTQEHMVKRECVNLERGCSFWVTW